jgi:hypothetical protein
MNLCLVIKIEEGIDVNDLIPKMNFLIFTKKVFPGPKSEDSNLAAKYKKLL